jgi:hypothetical protein
MRADAFWPGKYARGCAKMRATPNCAGRMAMIENRRARICGTRRKRKAFNRETKQNEALVLEFQPEETQWPGPPL